MQGFGVFAMIVFVVEGVWCGERKLGMTRQAVQLGGLEVSGLEFRVSILISDVTFRFSVLGLRV